jgi:hypothetical protein
MRKTWIAALMLILFVGCDPGWRYKIKNPAEIKSQRERYTVQETQGVETAIDCSLFSCGLSVNMEIVNRGDSPLSITPKLLRVVDAKGTDLLMERVGCVGSKSDDVVVLETEEKCELYGHFQVNPLWGPFTNRDLKHLTIFMDGVARGEKHIPLKFSLEWDL